MTSLRQLATPPETRLRITRREVLALGVAASISVSSRGGEQLRNVGDSPVPRSGRIIDGPRNGYLQADRDPALSAFAELLAWLFNTSFDLTGRHAFPSTPGDAGITRVERPTPTVDDDFAAARDRDFHERFASPFEIRNPYRYSRTRFGYYLGIDRYVRASKHREVPRIKDLASHEIRRLKYEFEWAVAKGEGPSGAPIIYYPCGPRRPTSSADDEAFARACSAYGTTNSDGSSRPCTPDDFTLDYARPFNDGHRPHTSFGVRRKGGAELRDLLIPPAPDQD